MHKRREGFTLIELLIVIVIIGILAAIAIPKFGATREKAYSKAMASDLRNLSAQQEIFYSNPANEYQYAEGSVGGGAEIADFDFSTSAGVTIEVTATDGGWYAIAKHAAFGPTRTETNKCGIYLGEDAGDVATLDLAAGVDVVPGVVLCEENK